MKKPLGLIEDGAMIAVTAVIGIIVIGRALELLEPQLRTVPLLGSLLTGVKAAWWTVFNP